MTAFYNEIDPYAAQWLRNLITAGHIAPGVVDERDVRDIAPEELHGFTQCHFFAGIGVWSHALRRAGWPDDRPVWTGSCPCQPFSVAGVGGGFDDERHLWPFFHYLIEKRSPPVVFGEQVASKDGLAWLDLVHADMEGTGYTFGAVDLCAAGVGAPHIRQRLWFVGVADAQVGRLAMLGREGGARDCGHLALSDETGRVAHAAVQGSQGCGHARGARPGRQGPAAQRGGADGGMGHHHHQRPQGRSDAESCEGMGKSGAQLARAVTAGGLADAQSQRHYGVGAAAAAAPGQGRGRPNAARFAQHAGAESPGPVNGLWRAADWLACRDGKWRPVEPGTFPLAHGAAARVGRLRAYGNAINAEAAVQVIGAFMDVEAGADLA